MRKKMVIITSYLEGESYGMLGPQMAATIIQDNTEYECTVIAVTRDDNKTILKKAIIDYFQNERPIIGFSTLSGREDLFNLAKELKEDGAITILAGPQADLDYLGEIDWKNYPHRFKGLSGFFSAAMQGPAEQAIQFLESLDSKAWENVEGLLYADKDGTIRSNSRKVWNEEYLKSVNWGNIFRIGNQGLYPLQISMGQVLQQVGCPHASSYKKVEIDYPASFKNKKENKIILNLSGCSFCDVAIDKGFYGELNMETVLSQIESLPVDDNNLKIPFELINENPLFRLPELLLEIEKRKIRLSQINLILRADWLLKGEKNLREVLRMASKNHIHILLSSVGFEAFDNTLLRNFHKGLTVETNLKAIRLIRGLKEEFPEHWAYSKTEGAIHGFIHPTPWDTQVTMANTNRNIAIYGLSNDILPPHSTPLIIHHASALGDWIREIEKREGSIYKRYASIIGWWDNPIDRIGSNSP